MKLKDNPGPHGSGVRLLATPISGVPLTVVMVVSASELSPGEQVLCASSTQRLCNLDVTKDELGYDRHLRGLMQLTTKASLLGLGGWVEI